MWVVNASLSVPGRSWVAQLVEHVSGLDEVTGSVPVPLSAWTVGLIIKDYTFKGRGSPAAMWVVNASLSVPGRSWVAQLVEHVFGLDEVMGSVPAPLSAWTVGLIN